MKRFFTVISLLTCIVSCKRDDEVYSLGNKKDISISGIIKFGLISNLNPEADTATLSLINIKINPEADSVNRLVTFNSNLGTFTNGKSSMTVTTDAFGNAQVGLRSASTGNALISATIKSATIDTLIHFVPALPDDITLTADNYSIDTTQTVNVTATLFRNPGRGIPSDPSKIWFTVTPNTLIYPPFVYSVGHVGSIAIKNPFNVKGTFKVEGKTLGLNNDTIRRSISILIK